jgi:hypothetical protein
MTKALTSSSAPARHSVFATRDRGVWLFGRAADLTVFGGSFVLCGLLLAYAAAVGRLQGDLPLWAFWSCIVGVDVAHVWATGFRVYFDRSELMRRPMLYLGIPCVCYFGALMAHAMSLQTFWRVLAYVAVFHFIRQQAGWVALYQRRETAAPAWERAIDKLVIYAVTFHPIAVWHTRLPEPFAWFVQGDFVTGLDARITQLTGAVMWFALAVFAAKEIHTVRRRRPVYGRTLIVMTTFACWYGGIVVLRSDYGFAMTNVLIHGIPYLYLGYRYARRSDAPSQSFAFRIARRGFFAVLITCITLAMLEEAVWDGLLWHEQPWFSFFRVELAPETSLWVVPLLALPQLTHYVLDAFVWRVRLDNPVLDRELEVA